MGSRQNDKDAMYVVEAIRGKRGRGARTQYRIKWLGYPEEQNTWEPLKNCAGIEDMIREYEAKQELLKPDDTRTTNSQPTQEPDTSQPVSTDGDGQEYQSDGQHHIKTKLVRKRKKEDKENEKPMPGAPINHRPKDRAESTPIKEYTFKKIRKCDHSEIEIVGAEPYGKKRIRVGVRALGNDKSFMFDSREVKKLWPQTYAKYLERYIRFRFDDS